MKLLKTIALGIFLAASSMGFSSVAVAEDEGRLAYTPSEAIDNVISKASEAIQAIEEQVHPSSEIAAIIKESSDWSKEINANDAVDVRRQRANAHLKKARSLAKKGKLVDAKAHLEEGKAAFAALKQYL